MPNYGETGYWDERYTREPSIFEWYQGYAGLKQLLHKHVPITAEVLQVGVGSSRLQEEMVRLGGYKGIVNIDTSTVAIEHLKEMHKALPQLKYQVSDCRSMPEFRDHMFDVIIDKGTMDAILCGEGSLESCKSMLAECNRVLKPGGTMLMITYGDPLSRLHYFLDPMFAPWSDVQCYCIAKLEQLNNGHDAASTVSEESLAPVIKGPYSYTNLDAMDALSNQEGVHYAYVLVKPGGALDSDTAPYPDLP